MHNLEMATAARPWQDQGTAPAPVEGNPDWAVQTTPDGKNCLITVKYGGQAQQLTFPVGDVADLMWCVFNYLEG